MPDRIYDGDFTEADRIAGPIFSAPFAGVNVDYILTEEYVQNRDNFASLPLNTPHPEYPDFFLVAEGDRNEIGGNIVQWTRTYAKVPTSYSEPGGNYSYNFIGFYGTFGVNVTTVTGRDRFTRTVPVKVVRDFYLVGAGQTYTDFTAIPKNAAQRYYYSATPTLDVDYLADSPPFTAATSPSRTAYEAMITADAYNIVVEDSTLTRWIGNIFVRETRYIKAQ